MGNVGCDGIGSDGGPFGGDGVVVKMLLLLMSGFFLRKNFWRFQALMNAVLGPGGILV